MAARMPQVILGTADGVHVLGGRSSPQLSGHEIRGLAPGRDGWWAIVDRRHVHVRPRGARWKRVASLSDVADSGDLDALCLLPDAPGLWIGTSHARLVELDAGRLALSGPFDRAPDRGSWFTPWGGPPDVRSLAAGSDGALYANVHVGGVLRSRDAGKSWKQMMDVACDAHQIAVHPHRPKHLFAATAVGLGVSRNAGATWRFEHAGLHATYQRAVAITRDRVLVSTSRSERGREAAVYRRAAEGNDRFVKCEAGLPRWFEDNINTFCLAGHDTCAAIGTADGRVFVSEDQGERWTLVGEGLPRILCVRIVAD